jgi:hypothetical protein
LSDQLPQVVNSKDLRNHVLEFPTKSGHEVKGYTDCSYSAGETYPSEEWRRCPL